MEILRQFIRGIFKYDSRMYRGMHVFLNFLSTMRRDSYKTWRTLRTIDDGSEGDPSPRSVNLRNLTHPMLFRPGTQDADTIISNVIREEYGHVTPTVSPKWMIDAGAYIGDTAAYFLSKFSDIKVIALEPNPPSYELALRNLDPYGERAILLKSGLSANDEVAKFSGEGTCASVEESGFEIDCKSVPTLLEQYSIPRLDILKMDIEGAEEEIFSSNPERWLGQVDMLIIEIHGPRIRSLISRVMVENGFSMKRFRSLWYCQSGQK